MRLISLLILLAIVVAIVIFALDNQAEVEVHFLDYVLTTSLAKLVGAVYLLGMVSGWSLIGILRRSWGRATAPASR
jgi:putative membrane protein